MNMTEHNMNKSRSSITNKDILSFCLHAVVMNGKIQVAWLLLFLASGLGLSHFSADMLLAVEQHGLSRENQNVEMNIHSPKDSEGMTSSQRAFLLGDSWRA